MESLQGILIIVFALLLLLSVAMMLATMRVKDTIKESFRCKSCKRLNKVNNGKCLHCGETMPKGYVYKSTFYGKTKCKNKEGHFDYKKTDFVIQREIVTWVVVIIALCAGIVCSAIFL